VLGVSQKLWENIPTPGPSPLFRGVEMREKVDTKNVLIR